LYFLRIEVALVHVLLLGEACDKCPEKDHDKNALPHGLGDLVPHLLVEEMHFLESLQVVETGGCVGDGPNAQVVHVGHQAPAVLEGHLLAWLKEPILVGGLAVVAADAQGVAKSQALIL